MINFRFIASIVALTLTFSTYAFAFPEMARHGYANCTSCHVSPSGGGVLTPYGRQLSGDLLSMAATEKETPFLHGVVKTPEWLQTGGDVRAVEIYRNTPQVTASRFLVMQEDIEFAATAGKFTADVNPGLYMQDLQLRRFFLNYRPTEELSFRFGKFRQAYGLMDPDHTTPIHRGLGWDEGTESYNLEGAWLGENLNAYLTGNFGPDSSLIPSAMKEKGVALRVGVPLGERYQVGLSYFRGSSPTWDRNVAGPFAILGFTRQFFLLSEIDFQTITSKSSASQHGWVAWNRLDYEIRQGLHAYLTFGQTRAPATDSPQPSSSWGIGSQWFPRPHFEFDFLWKIQSMPAFPSDNLSYATLLLHYYL